jgi:hypothetical protein
MLHVVANERNTGIFFVLISAGFCGEVLGC